MTARPHDPQLGDLLIAASLAEEARWRDARDAQPPVGEPRVGEREPVTPVGDPAAPEVGDGSGSGASDPD